MGFLVPFQDYSFVTVLFHNDRQETVAMAG
jgi:hypothetical protein